MTRAQGVLLAMAAVLALGAPAGAGDQSGVPAKQLFSTVAAPPEGAAQAPQAVGGYSRGCVAGAIQLAQSGPGWQAMRLSRNRRYGHPALVGFIERLSEKARAIGWPGLLVGDLAQPIGGPMRSGHVSHQSGIDADIWFRPAPDRTLTEAERESLSAPSYVARDRKTVTAAWTGGHHAVLRAAAEDPAVARIFVNAAIKQKMCDDAAAGGEPTGWLHKIRPWYAHRDHFHVRLSCPDGSPECRNQTPPPDGDGCDQIGWWFSDEALNPKPDPNRKPKPPLTLADMPEACRALLEAARK